MFKKKQKKKKKKKGLSFSVEEVVAFARETMHLPYILMHRRASAYSLHILSSLDIYPSVRKQKEKMNRK